MRCCASGKGITCLTNPTQKVPCAGPDAGVKPGGSDHSGNYDATGACCLASAPLPAGMALRISPADRYRSAAKSRCGHSRLRAFIAKNNSEAIHNRYIAIYHRGLVRIRITYSQKVVKNTVSVSGMIFALVLFRQWSKRSIGTENR